jgi:23S rRNA pseudouridine1911/1915/1917 synthase
VADAIYIPNYTNHIKYQAMRLDKLITTLHPEISRTQAKRLIEAGRVMFNKSVLTDVSANIPENASLEIDIPLPTPSEIHAEEIALEILFEDENMLLINKPAGMATHPGPGNYSGTLVHALLHHCKGQLSGIGGVERPGIVHRLDKETSGLMVAAKNDSAHQNLSMQLAERTLKRVYTAIVYGSLPKQSGIIEGNIARSRVNRKKMAVVEDAGKHAVTHYKVLESFQRGKFSLVECRLETGRTHQIRVHLSNAGCPLVGDKVYGNKAKSFLKGIDNIVANTAWSFPRQALHASAIGFIHPVTKEKLEFTCELAQDISALLKLLK